MNFGVVFLSVVEECCLRCSLDSGSIEPSRSSREQNSERKWERSFFEELRRFLVTCPVRSPGHGSDQEEKIVSDSEKTKDRTSEEDKSGQVGQESGPGHSGSVHCGSSGSTLVPNNPTHHIPTLNEVDLTNQTPTNQTNWNGNLVMYPTQTGGTYHNNTHIPHYLTTCYPFVQESYYFLPQSNCYRSQVRIVAPW